jgi:hypothetical protein
MQQVIIFLISGYIGPPIKPPHQVDYKTAIAMAVMAIP